MTSELPNKKLCELQLLKEHEYIAWKYKIRLSTPVIHITESRSRLGEWSPEKRQISISSHLIANFSWDCVINVLKHEIAHQIVSDIFHTDHEPAHGQSYQKACDLIGLEGIYRSATGDLPESERLYTDSEMSEEFKSVLGRIDKLLSLASSDNEHEAHAAMKKAQELQNKYNLSQLSWLSLDSYRYKIIELRRKKTTLQQSVIAAILQEFYLVNVIYSDLFCPQSGNVYKTIELLGTKENVANAEYTFHFLQNTIESLWHNYKSEHKVPGRLKRSYQYGLLKGFKDKMEAANLNSTPEMRSLVKVNNQYLQQFQKKRFPRLTKIGQKNGSIHGDTFNQGHTQGQKIVISKGVSSQGHGPATGKLLTHSKNY